MRKVKDLVKGNSTASIIEALRSGTGLGRGTLTLNLHKIYSEMTLQRLQNDQHKYLIGQLGLKIEPLKAEVPLKQLFPAHCIKILKQHGYDPGAYSETFLESVHNTLFTKTTHNDAVTFTFKENLLRDYCAGFTLATDLKEGHNLNLEALLNSRQFIIQRRFNYNYQPLLWFTAGHLRNTDTIHYYLDLITKPEYTHYGDTRSRFTINLLLRCLEESQLEKHHLQPQHQRIIVELEDKFHEDTKRDPEAITMIESSPTTYWRALWLYTQFETCILAPVSKAYPETLLPHIEKCVLSSSSEKFYSIYKNLIHLDISAPSTEKITQKINTKPNKPLIEILSAIGLYYPDQAFLKLRQLSAQKPTVKFNDQRSCTLFNSDSYITEIGKAYIRLTAFNGYCAIAKKHNIPGAAQQLIEQVLRLPHNESISGEIIAHTEDEKLVDTVISEADNIKSENPWDYKHIHAAAYKRKLDMIWDTQPLTEDKKIEFITTLGRYLTIQSIMNLTEAEYLSQKLNILARQYPKETIASITPLLKTPRAFAAEIAIKALVMLSDQTPEEVLPILKNELLKSKPIPHIHMLLLNLNAENLATLLPTISSQLDHIKEPSDYTDPGDIIYKLEIIDLAYKLATNKIEYDSAIKLLRKIHRLNNPAVAGTALLAIRDIIGHRNNPGLSFMMEVDHAFPERSATTFVTALSKIVECFFNYPDLELPFDTYTLSCFDKFVAADSVDVFDYLYYQIQHNNRLSSEERIIHLKLLARFTDREERHKVYHVFKDMLTHPDNNIVRAVANILMQNYSLELITRCWFELETPSDNFTYLLKHAYDQHQAVLTYNHDRLILHYDGDEIDINTVAHPEPFAYFYENPCQFLYPVKPTKVVNLPKTMLHNRYLTFMEAHSIIPTKNNTVSKPPINNDKRSFIEWVEQEAPNHCDSVAQLLEAYEEYINTPTYGAKT